MRTLKIHGPVFLLLLVVTFAAFWQLMTTPLWHGMDAQIFTEAYKLSANPLAMFKHAGFYFSQPLLELAFLAEFQAFGLNPTGYIGVNLFIHAFNAFVVYMLINMLFPKARIALLAALLFALGVGSYGKIFMNVHQLESLMLATFHLLVLYAFIRNDFRHDGRTTSPMFFLGIVLFLMTGLTKAASFSLIGCLIAYKAFFYKRREGRPILFSLDLLVFIVIGVLFYLAQYKWGFRQPTVFDASIQDSEFSWISVKNIFRYLNLMFFPMQKSPIVGESSFWVAWIFSARTVIRIFLTLAIVSYSFFGFVFGSRSTRFFIAWTYITLLPFTGLQASGNWLNLNHLYLTSLGFCVILAAGTKGTSRLLMRRRWRKYTPYLVPLAFVAVSMGLTHKLDQRNKAIADAPEAHELRQSTVKACQARPFRVQPGH